MRLVALSSAELQALTRLLGALDTVPVLYDVCPVAAALARDLHARYDAADPLPDTTGHRTALGIAESALGPS